MSEQNAAPVAAPEAIEAPEALESAEAVAASPAATPAEKVAAAKAIKSYKLKIYGKEVNDSFDINDEAEMTKRLQKSHSFDKVAQEKAGLEKSLAQFVDLIRTDPKKVLSHPDIGVDVKEFARMILNEQMAEEAKSPEQREKEKLQSELEELRNKYKKDEDDRKASEFKRLQDEQEEKITHDIKGALDSVKLPNSPRAIKYMAEYMSLALDHGVELSAHEVAPLVLKQMKNDYQEMLRMAPDDLLEDFIDKDARSRLQKRRIASMKKPVETANSVKPIGKVGDSKAPAKKKTIAEWMKD